MPFGLIVDLSTTEPGVAATAEELSELTKDGMRCPKCGDELIAGFGLLGGGYGPWIVCNNPGCGFTKKHDLLTKKHDLEPDAE